MVVVIVVVVALFPFMLIAITSLLFHRVVLIGTFGSMIAGQALSFTPDYLNAKVAAARLFKILATESKIDATHETGTKKVCLFLHFFG